MTIPADVIEIYEGGEIRRHHGVMEFLEFPHPGDRIVVPHPSGGIIVLQVAFTEHCPIWPRPKGSTLPPNEANVRIFGRWIKDEI